jgi:uncharacterized protein YbaP (TraB family)
MSRIAISLIAASLALSALPARAQPPVWIVRDKDSQIVLFGSLHLMPPGLDWEPPAVTAAVKAADDLWFELPIDGSGTADIQREALAHSQLPPGQSLTALLSPAGRKRLERLAMSVGVPVSALDRLQPWYAESALGVAVYRRQGVLAEDGVERQISDAAPRSAQRRAFETGAQQIAMLSQGSLASQVRSLETTLRELEADPKFVPRVISMWMAGDAGAIDKEVLGQMRRQDPDQYRRLIAQRNAAWVPLIKQRLAGSGRTVMVVGVGHLVGKDGVPALLRAQGIKVEGP